MINCNSRVQLMQACPVCPEPELDPTWQALARIATAADCALPFIGEADCWRAATERIPALSGVISYRQLALLGLQIEQLEAVEA